jgi:uncharacterized SAM-binding protein YcdF (DUF218 family)
MVRATYWVLRAVAVAVCLLTIGFIVFANAVTAEPAPFVARADAIVALTGGEDRIDVATKLLADGHGKRLLISGVNRRTTRLALERLTPESAHWFDCCIDIGYGALDTIGNADEAKAWVAAHGFASVVVVTANYHMPRSLAELGRAMPGVKLIPHPVAPHRLRMQAWWTSPGTTRLLLSEYAKLLPAAARLVVARMFVNSGSETATAAERVSASAL